VGAGSYTLAGGTATSRRRRASNSSVSPRAFAPLLLLTACATPTGSAAEPELGAESIFRLAAAGSYTLPDGVPDDLLEVPDLFRRGSTASLRDGAVIAAWTTAPTPSGDGPAMVWECGHHGDSEDLTWKARPDTGLVPLGVDVSGALPFTATHVDLAPAGFYLQSPSGPAWTVDGELGMQPWPLQARTRLVGKEDVEVDSPDPGALALARYTKLAGVRSMSLPPPTLDRAGYVLRLHTQGGLGPDVEGAPCDASDLPARADFSADFYFVRMPWATGD
jgi:hypothetical protein